MQRLEWNEDRPTSGPPGSAGRVAVIPGLVLRTTSVPMNSVTALSAPSLQPPAARDVRPHLADPHGHSSTAIDARVAAGSNGNGPAGDKPFTPLVRQFLNYLKLEKHFSDYTVKSYGADLIQFGQYLAGEIGRPIGSAAQSERPTPEQVDERQLKCEPLTVREFLAY